MYRCFLSSAGGPAQWPDASRLVEAMCVRLCRLHPAAVQVGGVRQRRWNAIIADYSHIRELVLSNFKLMDSTGLQLFELNQRTLTQWFVAFSSVSDYSLAFVNMLSQLTEVGAYTARILTLFSTLCLLYNINHAVQAALNLFLAVLLFQVQQPNTQAAVCCPTARTCGAIASNGQHRAAASSPESSGPAVVRSRRRPSVLSAAGHFRAGITVSASAPTNTYNGESADSGRCDICWSEC